MATGIGSGDDGDGDGGRGGDEEKSSDFYAVLGLDKECTSTELRTAYKKLAMRWHPDRCSSSSNSNFVDEAKKKFQAIQEAYSVLSDSDKRFLYDVGVYDNDDGKNKSKFKEMQGMSEFLNEMMAMMSQTKPCENDEVSFEQLQDLYEEMFSKDVGQFSSSSGTWTASCSSSSYATCYGTSSTITTTNKRNSSEMQNKEFRMEPSTVDASSHQSFCFGAGGAQGRPSMERKRQTRRNTKRSK